MTKPSQSAVLATRTPARNITFQWLSKMGWAYIPPEQAFAARGHALDQFIFLDVLRAELKKRRFCLAGQEMPFSDHAIAAAIADVCYVQLHEGLLRTGEQFHEALLYGLTTAEWVDGKKLTPTIPLIDWHNPYNNSFIFSELFPVLQRNGCESQHIDWVCFINGIPFVLIVQCDDDKMEVASLLDRFVSLQQHDAVPQLFVFSQLLFALNGDTARYTAAPLTELDQRVWPEPNSPSAELLKSDWCPATFCHANTMDKQRPGFSVQTCSEQVDDNVAMLQHLSDIILSPLRVLELTRDFMIFDREKRKWLANGAQELLIKKLVDGLKQRLTNVPEETFWLARVARAERALVRRCFCNIVMREAALKHCRIIVVTEQSLPDVTAAAEMLGQSLGHDTSLFMSSGTRLIDFMRSGTQRCVFTTWQKFCTAISLLDKDLADSGLIIFIEQGFAQSEAIQRTQLRQRLRCAVVIAFKEEPTTKTAMVSSVNNESVVSPAAALEHGAITPLLYEARKLDRHVDKKTWYRWINRLQGLASTTFSDGIRSVLVAGEVAPEIEKRFTLIAADVACSLAADTNVRRKGILLCDSEAAAIKYQYCLDKIGLFSSAIITNNSAQEMGWLAPHAADAAIDRRAVYGEPVARTFRTEPLLTRWLQNDSLKLLIVIETLPIDFSISAGAVFFVDRPLAAEELLAMVAANTLIASGKRPDVLIDYCAAVDTLNQTLSVPEQNSDHHYGEKSVHEARSFYAVPAKARQDLERLRKPLLALCIQLGLSADNAQQAKLASTNSQRQLLGDYLQTYQACFRQTMVAMTSNDNLSVPDADLQPHADMVALLSKWFGHTCSRSGHPTGVDNPRHVASPAVGTAYSIKESAAIYYANATLDNSAGDRSISTMLNEGASAAPALLQETASRCYQIFVEMLSPAWSPNDEYRLLAWQQLAAEAASVIAAADIEHSLVPQNRQSAITLRLLPSVLAQCKSVGGDVTMARLVVERLSRIELVLD